MKLCLKIICKDIKNIKYIYIYMSIYLSLLEIYIYIHVSLYYFFFKKIKYILKLVRTILNYKLKSFEENYMHIYICNNN